MSILPHNISFELKKYIRKFYLYESLKGLIIFTIFIFLLLLIFSFFNYYLYPNLFFKKLSFIFFILFSIYFFYNFILKNILKTLSILPQITHFEAATNISTKLPEIKDNLINILELTEFSEVNSLVIESIKQKSNNINKFDFSTVISIKQIRNYLYSLLVFFFSLFLLYLFNKQAIISGTNQFIDFNTYYEQPSPFSFNLINTNLDIIENSSYEIKLKVKGDYIPNHVFLIIGNNSIPMKKDKLNNNIFTYTIKNINKPFKFYFKANSYTSNIYKLNVLKSPKLSNFLIEITPPQYTHLKPFKQINNSNLIIPYGSNVNFNFNIVNVDTIFLTYNSKIYKSVKENNFNIDLNAFLSANYQIIVKNTNLTDTVLKSTIQIINDLKPNININSIVDSNNLSLYYFIGNIADDYGFSELTFNYAITNNNNTDNLSYSQIKININKANPTQSFNFMFDFDDLNLLKDKTVYYYFDIADNDYINHYKHSKTSIYSYYLPSLQNLDSLISNIDSTTNSLMNQAQQLSFEIKSEIEEFNNKMSTENVTEWEKENFLNNLFNKQELLENLTDSIKQLNNKKITNLKNYSTDSMLLKKQEEINKLLDDLLSPEIKELLDKLKKLTNKKDNVFKNLLNKSENEYKKYNDKINTTNELLKRMYIEQKTKNLVEQLKEHNNQTDSLINSINKRNDLTPSKSDSISSLKEQINNFKNDYDSLLKMNKQLKDPFTMDNFDSLFNSIKDNLNNANDNLNNSNTEKTKKDLKNASEQMKELSESMNQMLQSNISQNNGEDINTIKFILTNLLQLSFKHEQKLNKTPKKLPLYSNIYSDLTLQHKALYNEYLFIKDSLNSLANRNPMTATFILDEVNNLDYNYENLLNLFYTRSPIIKTIVVQRNIIEALNRLSLMMQQTMNNMQNMSNSNGKGQPQNAPCNKPSLQNLKESQQSLQNQLENMIQSLEEGKTPSNEQLAKQLAEQEAFQKMLQEMINKDDISNETSEMLKEISKLNNEVKKDILQNNLTNETLFREKQIKTKLLESENAEIKRKLSQKRNSNTTNDIAHTVPDTVFIKYKLNLNTKEDINNSNIIINTFYKTYYDEYIHKL